MKKWLLWPVAIAVLLGLQLTLRDIIGAYGYQIVGLAGINIILAISLNLINGYTGQFSIGHAGFYAVGAYTSAAFNVYAGAGLELADQVAGERPGLRSASPTADPHPPGRRSTPG